MTTHRTLLRAATLALLSVLSVPARATTNLYPSYEIIEGNSDRALFGWSVAAVGDVNGDGRADVVVGAPDYTGANSKEGAVFLYLGSATGYSSTPAWTVTGGQANASLGWSVASAGDVNGDGKQDVVVGAPGWSNGQTEEGRVVVYYGVTGGRYATSPSWSWESNQASAHLGHVVGGFPSFGGDTKADVFATAPDWDGPEIDEGKVFVFYGSATGPPATPSWTRESNQIGARLGSAAAGIGSVNTDTYNELVIGEMNFDASGAINAGRVEAFFGSASGPPASPSWSYQGTAANEFVGGSVGGGVDLGTDGTPDVVVGSWARVSGENQVGRVMVFNGSRSGLPSSASWSVTSAQSDAEFGFSVAALAVWSASAKNPLCVGSDLFDTPSGLVDAGRGMMEQLGAHNVITEIGVVQGPGGQNLFGQSMALAGLVNADTYQDVVVGAPWFSNGMTHEGAIFLFLGNTAGTITP